MKGYKQTLLCFMMSTVLCLAACGQNAQAEVPPLPEPQAEEGRPGKTAMVSESLQPRSKNASLYFLNAQDPTKLQVEMREVELMQNEREGEVVLKALFDGPERTQSQRIVPAGTKLEYLEVSGNMANVYVNSMFATMEMQEQLLARIAIINTLADVEDVEYANVFVDGVQISVAQYAFGAIRRNMGDLSALLAQKQAIMSSPAVLQNETPAPEQTQQEGLNQPTPTAEETLLSHDLNIVLYFMDPCGEFLLPEVRNVDVEDGDYVRLIFEELLKGPRDTTRMQSVMPDNIELVNYSQHTGANGDQLLYLNLSRVPTMDLTAGNKALELFKASFTYSMLSLVPDIGGIAFRINGQDASDTTYASALGGTLTLDMYRQYIGNNILLYFTDNNKNALIGVSRAVQQDKQPYVYTRLTELLRGPLYEEASDAFPIFPSGVTEQDLLGVMVLGDCIGVNFSENILSAMQQKDAAEERIFVFSIINTIAQMEGVKRVQFYVNGKPVETLSGHLYLGLPLMKNEGLIRVR